MEDESVDGNGIRRGSTGHARIVKPGSRSDEGRSEVQRMARAVVLRYHELENPTRENSIQLVIGCKEFKEGQDDTEAYHTETLPQQQNE